MCGAQPGARCLTKNGKKRGRPHSARTNPIQKESAMSTSQEVIITDEMRRADERVKVQPFRHPWIKGTDTDPECGRTWHDHGWIDRGDHGFTVCPTQAVRPDVLRDREAQAAAKALREFARRQDTWCEAGRAEQIIPRAAMRDALNREADRMERGES